VNEQLKLNRNSFAGKFCTRLPCANRCGGEFFLVVLIQNGILTCLSFFIQAGIADMKGA
jgi:hypothetical protein